MPTLRGATSLVSAATDQNLQWSLTQRKPPTARNVKWVIPCMKKLLQKPAKVVSRDTKKSTSWNSCQTQWKHWEWTPPQAEENLPNFDVDFLDVLTNEEKETLNKLMDNIDLPEAKNPSEKAVVPAQIPAPVPTRAEMTHPVFAPVYNYQNNQLVNPPPRLPPTQQHPVW